MILPALLQMNKAVTQKEELKSHWYPKQGEMNRKVEKKLAYGLEDMDNTKQIIVACKGGMVKAEICHEKGESWDPAWRKAQWAACA